MEEAGLKPVVVRHGNFTYESGYELAKAILETEKVEAIICGNDLMAVGTLRAAEDLGMRVPQDLSIAGFDHVLFADLVRPRLTAVSVPAYEIGMEAMLSLLSEDITSKRFPVKLIIGESTKEGDATKK